MRQKARPRFKSQEEEADFWMRRDTADFWDALEEVEEPLEVAPALKAEIRARHERAKLISLRLYPSQIRRAKAVAGRKRMPYQLLLRQLIDQGLSLVADRTASLRAEKAPRRRTAPGPGRARGGSTSR